MLTALDCEFFCVFSGQVALLGSSHTASVFCKTWGEPGVSSAFQLAGPWAKGSKPPRAQQGSETAVLPPQVAANAHVIFDIVRSYRLRVHWC